MTVPLDRIPDSLGYLVLTEDGAVANSGGDLENNEDLANKFLNIVHNASRIPLSTSNKDKFRKITVVLDSFMYVITVSGHKIYVCKRKYVPADPVSA
ncbi:ragulator complex protein LAMTOR4-like isoform X2 [Ruditapes philippinarum]|nr:ragulator complex protein LAMTOR4-like isoform X2 [Ruditapes philippinarum]